MKILHICTTGPYTDGLNYQENLLTKFQVKEGHEVFLLASQWEWGARGNVEKCDGPCTYTNQDGVSVIRLPIRGNKDIFYRYKRFLYFYQTLENVAPDVIFIHNVQFFDIDKIRKYAQKHPVRIYVDNHADFSNSARSKLAVLFYKTIWRHMAQIIEPYTTKFYGVLPARVDWLIDMYKLPKDKCELLVMGADDEEVERAGTEENRHKVRESLNIPQDDFLIVTGGKIDAWKTQTLLLMEAVNRIANPKLKLLIFGPVTNEIKGQFDELFNPDTMRYVPWANSSQSYDYFAIADLVVFPGRHSVYWEQAAGQGKPILCKYWEGTTHVDLGGNVEFLKRDSTDEIEGNIKRILYDSGVYSGMNNVASSKGKTYFSYNHIARIAIEAVK